MVVRASSGKEFLGGLLSVSLFERVSSRAHLLDLILDPGLLGLDFVAVLTGHGRGTVAQQVSHVVHALAVRGCMCQLRAVTCGSA